MATGGHYITVLLADCITGFFLPSSFYGERCYGIHLYGRLISLGDSDHVPLPKLIILHAMTSWRDSLGTVLED